jgi:hypothetical protein
MQINKIGFIVYRVYTIESFIGSWPLFRFLNLLHSREDSLDGGTARREVAAYTQSNKNTE